MNNIFYVYEWTRLDTGEVFHVGKGSGDRYKNKVSGRNKHFKNIVNSVEIKSEIVIDNMTELDAFQAEMFFICHYKSIGQANTNYSLGGKGGSGWKLTEEQRKNQSNGQIGKKLSEAHRLSMSLGMKGRTSGRKGKKNREESNKKGIETKRNNFPKFTSTNVLTGEVIVWSFKSECAISLFGKCRAEQRIANRLNNNSLKEYKNYVFEYTKE
jgi:hypothetical protein